MVTDIGVRPPPMLGVPCVHVRAGERSIDGTVDCAMESGRSAEVTIGTLRSIESAVCTRAKDSAVGTRCIVEGAVGTRWIDGAVLADLIMDGVRRTDGAVDFDTEGARGPYKPGRSPLLQDSCGNG